MAVFFFFLHIGTELKWLQIQRKFCMLYIYVSVILTKTSSGQHGHVLFGIMDAAVSDWTGVQTRAHGFSAQSDLQRLIIKHVYIERTE